MMAGLETSQASSFAWSSYPLGPQLGDLPMAFPYGHGPVRAGWLGSQGQRLRRSHVEGELFYGLVLKTKQHYFCCVVFIRSQSLRQIQIQGRNSIKEFVGMF